MARVRPQYGVQASSQIARGARAHTVGCERPHRLDQRRHPAVRSIHAEIPVTYTCVAAAGGYRIVFRREINSIARNHLVRVGRGKLRPAERVCQPDLYVRYIVETVSGLNAKCFAEQSRDSRVQGNYSQAQTPYPRPAGPRRELHTLRQLRAVVEAHRVYIRVTEAPGVGIESVAIVRSQRGMPADAVL